jgi:hypothetical protein
MLTSSSDKQVSGPALVDWGLEEGLKEVFMAVDKGWSGGVEIAKGIAEKIKRD